MNRDLTNENRSDCRRLLGSPYVIEWDMGITSEPSVVAVSHLDLPVERLRVLALLGLVSKQESRKRGRGAPTLVVTYSLTAFGKHAARLMWRKHGPAS